MTPAVIKKTHDAVLTAFNDPAVRETMARQGNSINITSPEQAQKAFHTELAKYAALVKKAGIQPE
jgi:tripartite-type tricarboxylate transporter receptor subunit TctC